MTSSEPDEDKGAKLRTPVPSLRKAEALASLPVLHVIIIPNWIHPLKDILKGAVNSDCHTKKVNRYFGDLSTVMTLHLTLRKQIVSSVRGEVFTQRGVNPEHGIDLCNLVGRYLFQRR